MDKLLELKSVNAAYHQDLVLKDVNLSVYHDDFIGVIGPNGGGKTTLLKIILGTLKPINGERFVYESKIGYLPQMNRVDYQFPISVLQVVLSGLMGGKKLWGCYENANNKKQALALMEQMGIRDLKNRNIGELSGGQLQRVFLCRAMISNPKLLILDEPNTYVDNRFEEELYEILDQMSRKMAIIIVSHDLGTICSHVKTIACVNKTLCYHHSNIISKAQLDAYNCPIDLITHGEIPHRVLKQHH